MFMDSGSIAEDAIHIDRYMQLPISKTAYALHFVLWLPTLILQTIGLVFDRWL